MKKSTNFFVPLFKSFLTGLPKRVVTVLATFFLVINQVIIPVPNSLLPTLSPAIAQASEDNGTTVSIEASGDAYLSKQNPDQNYGITDLITVDGQDINGDPNTELRGLIKWNLSQLPEGSVVQSARIILHLVNHSGGNVYTLHKSTKDWHEADVTWNNASADFESASLGILSSNILGLHSIPLNSDGIAAIQSWIDNPETNFGFLILPDANSTNGFEFKSKDSSIKPVLEVTVTFPQDASYNVEMSVSGDGAIFVSPEQPFGFNDNVTFTAEANDGWQFERWEGDLGGVENPATIQIQNNMNVMAVFQSLAPAEPQMGMSTCGNGVLENGEQCEGSNLGGQSCSTLGNGSGTLVCASDCTFNMGSCAFAWPAEAFASAENLTYIDSTGFGVNLSGAAWNPVSRKLWLVRNGGPGGSKLWVLRENGSGGFEVDYKNGLRGEWSNFNDLEAIALADFNNPDVVYLLIEGEERIKRYNISTYGTAILERNWNTSPHLPLNGGSGAEALAFIPDSFLTAQGFVDPAGNPRTSQNGMGGLMFVGHQNGGRIYVFDLNPNNDSFTYVGAYRTNYSETADLAFDRSTGYLYVFHGANHNHTEVVSLASTVNGSERKLVTLVDYNRPTGSATNSNMEGIAVVETSDCADGKRDFFLTIDDGGADSLFRFRNFPCGLARNKAPVVNAGSDQTITFPNAAALNASASDDRLPNGTITTTWTQIGFVPAPGVSGSGVATFDDSTALATNVNFDLAGDYTLRMTVTDGELSAADDVIVTVDEAARPVTFTINASAGSNGFISPIGEVIVDSGANQTFTIAPNANYHIANVLVDGASVGAVSSYTFSNVTANHTIAASFEVNTYTIDSSAGSNGSISPAGVTTVNHGGSQTFTMTPSTGYHVADVLVDGASVGAVSSYTFSNVTADHTIEVSFAASSFTITATAGTNGSISPSGDVDVSAGDDQVFTITPNSGFQIQNVTVDGQPAGVLSTHTFSNVTANHTIHASFVAIDPVRDTYLRQNTPTTNYGSATSVNVDGDEPAGTGHDVFGLLRFNVAPIPAGSIIDAIELRLNITNDTPHTYRIYEVKRPWSEDQATWNQAAAGMPWQVAGAKGAEDRGVILANIGPLALGQQTILLNDAAKNIILGWANNPANNHGLMIADEASTNGFDFASFESATPPQLIITHRPGYTMTTNVNGNGSVSKNPDQQYYTNGSNVTLTANAGANSVFTGWSGDATGTTNPLSVSMNSDKNITANFTIRTYTLTASAGANGSISPAGVTTVNHGASQTYTMTPATGYHVANVLVDGASVGAVSSYTFSNVTAAHTISVSFAINTYTVTTTATSNGTISLSPNQASYNHGSTVTVTATPNSGYTFANWTGSLSGSVNPATLTMDSNKTIGAVFAQIPTFTITPSAGLNGSISPDTMVNVMEGEDQTFTITPAAGYHIEDVLVDGTSVGAVASYTFSNVTANHTIAASFAVNTFALSASVSGNGSISKNPDQPYYNNGSSVTLTANAGADSVFIGWSGDASGTANPLSVTMNGDKNITANFAVRTYSLTASVEGSGSISPSGVTSVSHGGSLTYTITPAAGYRIQFVKVDGVSVGAVESYTFNNVTANHTIAATFSVNTFIVSASNGSNGNISPVGNTPVNEGADQTYVITPDSGYAIEDVRVDNQSMGAIPSYTFSNVTANHTISASFTMIRRALTISTNRGLGGAVIINPDSPDGTYLHGTEVTLTAIANPGNIFSGWSGDAAGLINPVTITMDADKNVTANFSMITYSIEVETTTGGAVEVSPEGPHYLGDEITLTATPDSTHTFNGWSGDVTGSENPISVTVTGNMNIAANFAPITYTLNITTIGNGTVTKSPNMTDYPAGTSVTLTANPARFWNFLRWTGNASGTNPVITVVMDGNKNIQARFKQGLSPFSGGGPAS